MIRMRRRVRRPLVALAFVAALAVAPVAGAATITVLNLDAAGEGFNDPTVVGPVGGNAGTTLGAQRLAAFEYAAGIWAATLTSDVEITIDATMAPKRPANDCEFILDYPLRLTGN